jgi:uncharacterized damage-inducible protein DinB
MLEFLNDLLAHMEWANAELFQAWSQSPARDNEELRKRISHLSGVQAGFLAIFRGEEPGGPRSGAPPTYDELLARARHSHDGLREYMKNLAPESLSGKVQITWFRDPPCIITLAEALVQVAMHAQHHRGQCMTRLKDFGGEPRNVDWIIWLWKQKPPAQWS